MRKLGVLAVAGLVLVCISGFRIYKSTTGAILIEEELSPWHSKEQSPALLLSHDHVDTPTVSGAHAHAKGQQSRDNATHTETVQIGRIYNARACHLEPGWAGIGIGIASKSTNLSCVGKHPALPNSSAAHLTCHDSNTDIYIPQKSNTTNNNTTSQKPNLTDRSHPGVTIALLYFAKPALLLRQLQEFASYPIELQQQLSILIVDDASPPGLQATDYIHKSAPHAFRIRVARILTPRDWNIGGARNLAFYLSDTSRTLLLDLDILIPHHVFQAALSWPMFDHRHQQPPRQLAHRFNRRRPKDGSTRVHPAVSILSTTAYWENGGCDEDFCGNYGYTDVHFWFRWKMDPTRLLKDHMDVYLVELESVKTCDSEFLGNGTQLQILCKEASKQFVKPTRNLKKNHALYKEKTSKGCWSNRYLRFRWILHS